MDHITAPTIRRLMRRHGKTIRGIAVAHDLTLTRVRQVRDHGVTGRVFVMDWMQIITGRPYAGWDVVAAAYL